MHRSLRSIATTSPGLWRSPKLADRHLRPRRRLPWPAPRPPPSRPSATLSRTHSLRRRRRRSTAEVSGCRGFKKSGATTPCAAGSSCLAVLFAPLAACRSSRPPRRRIRGGGQSAQRCRIRCPTDRVSPGRVIAPCPLLAQGGSAKLFGLAPPSGSRGFGRELAAARWRRKRCGARQLGFRRARLSVRGEDDYKQISEPFHVITLKAVRYKPSDILHAIIGEVH